MDDFNAMWAAVQQSVYIAFGPIILWILGLLIGAGVLLLAWTLGASLFRKYIG